MPIEEWISEFQRICPAHLLGTDLTYTAQLAIADGISPLALWRYLHSLPSEALEKIARLEEGWRGNPIQSSETICAHELNKTVQPQDLITGKKFMILGKVCEIKFRENIGRGGKVYLDWDGIDDEFMPAALKISYFCKNAKPID